MPLLRRPAPAPVRAAAAARVEGLLVRRGGWTLPPAGDDALDRRGAPDPEQHGAPCWTPRADGPSGALDQPGAVAARPGAVSPQPGAVAPQPGAVALPPGPEPEDALPARHAAPTVLERLRAGRLDPGRRAVAGLAAVGLLACLLAGAVVLRSAPEEVALPAVERAGAPLEAQLPSASAAPAAEVVVAVAGRVRRPGLVRLAPGSRVGDALRAAGGVQPGADVGLLNLARKVVDGEQVLVGVGPAPGAPAPAGGGGAAADPVVDLNAATAADLDELPGIGPVLAERIVDHRTTNGPFASVDQLREVSGIGEAKYATLKDLVRV